MTTDRRGAAWVGLGQVALVLLSVGLGFAVSEWRQSAADDVLVRQAADAAVREMATNRVRVREALAYHEALYDDLAQGASSSLELRSAFVVDNAWETAQSAGVVPELPYAVTEVLARTHELQTTYQELAKMNLGLLYFGNVYSSDRLPSDVRGYAPNVSDLRFFEHQLVRAYDEALSTLHAEGFAVPDSLLADP